MENKFNDFSRFKNNQLRSYFRQKEDNEINFKNPFSSSILSALTLAIFWSIKDSFPKITENIWLKCLIYPMILLIAFAIIYFIYYHFLNYLSGQWQKFSNTRRFTRKQRNDKYYLDKFKFEVVNQVSLSLSIISHKDDILDSYSDTEKRMLELENRFYVVEAFYHLNDALEILQTEILLSPFYKKVVDDNYTKINQRRIKELIDLSTSLYFQFKIFWNEQGLTDCYKSELNDLKTTIKDIEKRI